MRVISGLYKGRKIEGFDIDGTRPTMDRVRESLFAMIQNYIDGSVVLDLFSGSGALGIEALSEGASYSYFVDSNIKACNVIKNNINNFNINDFNIIHNDYKKALLYFYNNNIKFDIIFIDPPYKTNYIEESILLIQKYNLLNKDGIIICESDNLNKIIYPDCFMSIKEKKYGDKYIVLLKNMLK